MASPWRWTGHLDGSVKVMTKTRALLAECLFLDFVDVMWVGDLYIGFWDLPHVIILSACNMLWPALAD